MAHRASSALTVRSPEPTAGPTRGPGPASAPADTPQPALDPHQLVATHRDRMVSYALRRLGSRAEAEDAVQESLLAALRAQHTYRGQSAVRTWLFGILKHKIIDQMRRRKREVQSEEPERLASLTGELGGGVMWASAEHDSDPERNLSRRELLLTLERCLRKLPPKQAQAFVLCEIAGLGGEEICRRLDISATNYWVLLHRARRRLRKSMPRP